MIYGLLVTASPFATMAEQTQFRRVSIDWHRILHFASTWEEQQQQIKVEDQQQMALRNKQAQIERWQRMQAVDVEAQLRRLYGEEARFRGVQKPALDAIIAGAPRVLVVMRTGGGKSTFFMLPAMGSPNGVTIVIVPTVSLRQDLFERCQWAQMACAEWNGRRPPYHARIILVTPESAVTLAFDRFIGEKRLSHQLERIVIDECHVILESIAKGPQPRKKKAWRPEMLRLCEMAQKEVQVLYLTATLPPSEEAQFFHTIGVPETEVVQFREATTRPNVAYQVVEYRRDEEDEAVQRLVEQMKEKYPAPGQIIVYCKKVVQAERLAGVLQCSVYHRTIGDATQKRAILQQLTGQTERVFTATNALGLGVDAPCIRAVIHVGIREQLKQYAQESGRAGRDGGASEAIIMRAVWLTRGGQEKEEQGWRPEEAMKAFLAGESCRRIALDRHMDGRSDRVGCERGEERCDICQGAPRGRKRRRIVVNNSEGVSESEVEDEIQVSAKRPRTDQVEEGRQGQQRYAQEQEEEERRQQRAQQAIAQEQAVYEQIRHGQRRSRVDAVGIAEGFEQQLSQWQGRCYVCIVQGRDGSGHSDWRACPYNPEERQKMEQVLPHIQKIQFEPYAQCTHCGVPQAVCYRWEDISHSGPQRYRRRATGACQFAGIVYEAVAAVLAFCGDDPMQWIEEQVAQAGSRVENGEGGWEEIGLWLGRRIQLEGIELSGLCRFLYEMGLWWK